MSAIHHGSQYNAAVKALKARGDAYCWRQCGRYLLATAPRGHPQAMTLGHIIAAEDRPDLFLEPSNHAPECAPCNYADGARRTNAKRAGQRFTPRPLPRISKNNDRW